MRIAIFGAAGNVGSRILAEAVARGHEVKAVTRSAKSAASLTDGVTTVSGNAADPGDVAAISAGHDVVISATKPPPGQEHGLAGTLAALLEGTSRSGARIILVGGSARLKLPAGGLVRDSSYIPTPIRPLAKATVDAFQNCVAQNPADWTYVSPPARLVPGERTGRYRVGSDTLLFNAEDESEISIEDFAVALLDEAESPQHRRLAFTVVGDPLPVAGRDVSIRTPDGVCDAYFASPPSGKHPGILVWPDALGLRCVFRSLSKRLARAGYSVLVVNPHYRAHAAPISIDPGEFQDPEKREQVFSMARALTPELTRTDSAAFLSFLDQQSCTDSQAPLGVIGYCMGGAMAIRTAALSPERVGLFASFHGGKLVSDRADSPHRLFPKIRARGLIAIAQSDDDVDPSAKKALADAVEGDGVSVRIDVFEKTRHGWCMLDLPVYDHEQAERAWTELLREAQAALRVIAPVRA